MCPLLRVKVGSDLPEVAKGGGRDEWREERNVWILSFAISLKTPSQNTNHGRHSQSCVIDVIVTSWIFPVLYNTYSTHKLGENAAIERSDQLHHLGDCEGQR